VKEFFLGLGANSVVLAIVAWLVKSIVAHQMDKDTAEFKVNLKASTDRQMENYRAGLEKEQIRLQISYGGIFEKQAEAILELYKLCTKYRRDAFFAMDAVDNGPELAEFRESYRLLYECYEENRILLPESLDREVRKFVLNFHVKVPQHQRMEKQYSRVNSEEAFDRLWARQEVLRKSIEEEMPDLLEKLVSMMREMLGTDGLKSVGVEDGT